MTTWRITMECACIFAVITVSGCATNESDIPRQELRQLFDEYGYERLDNGCFVVPPSKDAPEGQVICPEVKFPENEEETEQARP